MLSNGVCSASLITHLNEVPVYLVNLKTYLIKTHNGKLASLLKCLPNTKTECKKVSLLPIESLPSDWLDRVKIPNTIHVCKGYPADSLGWESLHNSAESSLYNKHRMALPFESQLLPFYCQRMMPKRAKFFQYVQKRSIYMSQKHILSLEDIANSEVNNPEAQAVYLNAVVNEDPDYVIRRYESKRYASNEEIKDIYMKALLLTNKLSVSEAGRRFSGNVGGANAFNAGNDGPSGTEDQPLHILRTKEKGSILWSILTYGVTVAIVFTLISNIFPKNVLDVLQKEILPDQSEKKVKFEDVQGCDEAKEELKEVVQYLQNPEKFEKLGAKLPRGVLLIGPPGTGKTLLARAIAGEADVPFFFVSGSEFDEMFVGVGAARVRRLFESAKKHSPSIIFIDELDAIGGTRVANDVQPYSRMTLNQILVELDGFDQSEGVIVIAATNFPDVLDKALTRPGRFDSKVHVTKPDVRGRINILKLYINKNNCADDIDVEVLAQSTPGFTGADLSNLANQAALRAAALQEPLITKEHFEWARDKILMGPERKSAVVEKENQTLVAYYESGRAIVAHYTKDAQPVHKITVIPRGEAPGFVMQLPSKDETSISRKRLLAMMDVRMGGRVAEEIMFGEDSITTVAQKHMNEASKIARAMVTKYGMSEKVGVVLIDEKKDKISPELQDIIESEVKRLTHEAHVRAKTILNKYSKEHKRLAEALLKYETLDSKEIDLVLKGKALGSR